MSRLPSLFPAGIPRIFSFSFITLSIFSVFMSCLPLNYPAIQQNIQVPEHYFQYFRLVPGQYWAGTAIVCHAARFVAKCSQNTEKTKGKHSLYLPLLYQLLIAGGIADIPKTEHVTTPPKFKTLDQTPKIAIFELLSRVCRMGVSVAISVVLLPCVSIVPLTFYRFKNYFILNVLCGFYARTLTRRNSWERGNRKYHPCRARSPLRLPRPRRPRTPTRPFTNRPPTHLHLSVHHHQPTAARTESPTSPPRG